MSDILIEETVAAFTVEPEATVAVSVEESDGVTTVTIDRPAVVIETAPVGLQGPPGPQGLQGLQGQSGGFFEYVQVEPLAIWTIVHNMGFYPSVTAVDSAGSQVEGHVIYLNLNSVTIEFVAAFSGHAHLS